MNAHTIKNEGATTQSATTNSLLLCFLLCCLLNQAFVSCLCYCFYSSFTHLRRTNVCCTCTKMTSLWFGLSIWFFFFFAFFVVTQSPAILKCYNALEMCFLVWCDFFFCSFPVCFFVLYFQRMMLRFIVFFFVYFILSFEVRVIRFFFLHWVS